MTMIILRCGKCGRFLMEQNPKSNMTVFALQCPECLHQNNRNGLYRSMEAK